MERIELAGAWEGDALPGGRFCAAYPDGRIATHAGVWQAPEWLRYPRLNPLIDLVAGSRQGGRAAVVAVDPLGWAEVAPQSCGLSAVIYHPDGSLQVNADCADPYYSLGFRYMADRVYSGAETYADAARQIYEWTTLDGITIGQGPAGGCHVLYSGRRFLLEPGPTTVVRFTKVGEACAVGIFRHDRGFVGIWLTVAEILTLPEILAPDPPDPPDPEPDPMQPPIVTVERWTLDELLDGREFTFTDSGNPALGYRVKVYVANGSMYATITNAAGTASTGLDRPVIPCDDHEPDPPEPPDPDPVPTTISTVHGTFWHTLRDGKIAQSDTADQFTLEQIAPGKFAILAPNTCYIAAEGGGADDYLIANRPAAGGWETFTAGPSADTDRPLGVTLRADNGSYVCAEGDGRITCTRPSAGAWETFVWDRPVGTLPRLEINGQYFRQATGARWHGIETSDFSLYKYFLDGQAIDPVLEHRAGVGFNLLRVWLLNTSVIPGGLEPKDYLGFYDSLPSFLERCAAFGHYVELTAFTQTQTLMPDPDEQLAHWAAVVDAVRAAPNALLELCNEIDQHDNAPSAHFPRPSGVLASSGSNGSDAWPPEPHWDYCLYHTNDANEWQRRCGHNAMEISDHHDDRPTMSNENTRATDRDSDLDHFYDAAAGAALLCAGACFHSQAGKVSTLWSGHELECAKSWVAGSRSVPLEYQPGNYARHDELNGPDCIRAYSRTLPDGRSWLVKIRP